MINSRKLWKLCVNAEKMDVHLHMNLFAFCSFSKVFDKKKSSIPGFPCKVQYWIQRERVFSFLVKLSSPSWIMFWSSSQLCHFFPKVTVFMWNYLFVCRFAAYLFHLMFSFSISNCTSFTLFTLFWVRRPLLFCLLRNCQTIPKGYFHFLYLYEKKLFVLFVCRFTQLPNPDCISSFFATEM